ncbi:MAG: Crp/Fnr family transcriptional regulator [Cytophaga sp.]|uniref:Crp/Fnr family transcriptional regulator n=1 Tax=Cytophaga sp. TaxID=29535 RepID=UPI003F81A453
MVSQNSNYLSDLKINWKDYIKYLHKIELSPKTRLLNKGEIADKIYIIESGSVRMGFEKDGKDITMQFFFENELFTSVESMFGNLPSNYFIETIEQCTIYYLTKDMLNAMVLTLPEMASVTTNILMSRLIYYSNHLHSYLSETPEQRFNSLLENRPYIFMRVSQRHIASYLGITNVSLSRIKARRTVTAEATPTEKK